MPAAKTGFAETRLTNNKKTEKNVLYRFTIRIRPNFLDVKYINYYSQTLIKDYNIIGQLSRVQIDVTLTPTDRLRCSNRYLKLTVRERFEFPAPVAPGPLFGVFADFGFEAGVQKFCGLIFPVRALR